MDRAGQKVFLTQWDFLERLQVLVFTFKAFAESVHAVC